MGITDYGEVPASSGHSDLKGRRYEGAGEVTGGFAAGRRESGDGGAW